jgi:hypothetical protein
MKKTPKIELKDFFPDVKVRHLDAAVIKSIAEYVRDPELQESVTTTIQNSRETSEAILSLSARSVIEPPVIEPPAIATILQMGIIIGVGLSLELLNEREDPPEEFEEKTPSETTIQ